MPIPSVSDLSVWALLIFCLGFIEVSLFVIVPFPSHYLYLHLGIVKKSFLNSATSKKMLIIQRQPIQLRMLTSTQKINVITGYKYPSGNNFP